MKAFSTFAFHNGFIDNLDRAFPSYLSAWHEGIDLYKDDTHFLYVFDGVAELTVFDNTVPFPYDAPVRRFPLYAGMYASVPGPARIERGRGIVVSRKDWLGFLNIGQIEHEGRLKYIDGCTDSLLVPPVRMGDPCLNLLYFPPDIDQTAHTHPSDRIGMVLSGRGRCHAWNDGREEVIDLVPNLIFCIHTDGKHKFSTPYGHHMRVLAYHPDSDFGPTDQEHPMINRTIVDGVSASKLPDIQTK